MAGGAAMAADTDPLIELLKSKGVISANDAASIERAPDAQRHDRLVELLRAKGVITASDAASVSTHVASASPAPQITSAEAQAAFSSDEYVPAEQPVVRTQSPHRAPVAHTVTVSDTDDATLYDASARNEPPANALSFKIGGVSIYPGAAIVMTSVTRGTEGGSGIATNFAALPFENQIQGAASDTHLTAAATMLDLRAITDIGPAHVDAYIESDFNGSPTTNAMTPRLRLAYVDTTWGGWELMFGQAYSWLTPNRVGLGPSPSDVFLTHNIDQSFAAGLTWAREAQVRIAYHPTDNFALGIAVENSDPFAPGVTYPSSMNYQLNIQNDNGSGSYTASRFPDVIGKMAFDTNPGGDGNFHGEVTGLLTSARATTICPYIPGATIKQVCPNAISPVAGFVNNLTWGGGVGVGLNWQVVHNLNLIANGFDSDGGGRYIGNLGPDFVVLPSPVTYGGSTGYVGQPSMVRSYAVSGGAEWKIFPGTEFDAYYSAAYFGRNYATDLTSSALYQPNIGYGYPPVIIGGIEYAGGSANTNNRLIQEVSGDLTQDFWSDPTFGVVQIQTQLSWVNRRPWFVAAGAPHTASELMGFVDLRLLIP